MIDDQLPEALTALFAAERSAPVASGGAKAIVKAKLAASVAGAPLGAGASVLGAAGKLIGMLAIGVGIGAGAIAVTRGGREPVDVPPAPRVEIAAPETTARVQPDRPSAPTVAPPASAPVFAARVERDGPVALPAPGPVDRSARPAAIAQAAPAPAPIEPVAIPAALPSPDTTPPPAAPPPEVVGAVPESTLLGQAWSALSQRDPARALVLVGDGERAYPGGPLSEERDAIRISALSQLRRRDETRAAAAQFLVSYPHSIHRPLVQRALQETP